MFHCLSKRPDINENKSTDPEQITDSRRGFLTSIAAVGGVALSSHALCLVGLSGGGYALSRWCGHGGSPADDSQGILLSRLSKVPDTYQQFPQSQNEAARLVLLKVEPKFNTVIEAKKAEAEGKPIEVVFLEDQNQQVSVIICKEGALCPCSKPQAYNLGNHSDIAKEEAFPGQHALLRALYSHH